MKSACVWVCMRVCIYMCICVYVWVSAMCVSVTQSMYLGWVNICVSVGECTCVCVGGVASECKCKTERVRKSG